jgi:hypothetical protein
MRIRSRSFFSIRRSMSWSRRRLDHCRQQSAISRAKTWWRERTVARGWSAASRFTERPGEKAITALGRFIGRRASRICRSSPSSSPKTMRASSSASRILGWFRSRDFQSGHGTRGTLPRGIPAGCGSFVTSTAFSPRWLNPRSAMGMRDPLPRTITFMA